MGKTVGFKNDKELDLEVHPDKLRLAEIGQNNNTELAFCRYDKKNDRLVQCHQFIHCRDFMLDACVGAESNREISIYGFKYSKTYPRPDQENISLLLRIHDDGKLKALEENLSILRSIEDFMGWDKSVATLTQSPGKEKIVWMLGDAKWMKSALSVSLYTYLMKCLTYNIKDKTKWMDEIKAQPGVEASYMDKDYLNFLFQNMDDILDQYKTFSGFSDQDTVETNTIHYQTGFRAMMNLLWNKKSNDGYSSKIFDKHALKGYKAPK